MPERSCNSLTPNNLIPGESVIAPQVLFTKEKRPLPDESGRFAYGSNEPLSDIDHTGFAGLASIRGIREIVCR